MKTITSTVLNKEEKSHISQKYSALLFDLDETLIDFYNTEKQSLDLVYEKFYASSTSQSKFTTHFHKINKQLWADFEKDSFPLSQIGIRRFELLSEKIAIDLDHIEVAEFYETQLGEKSDWLPDIEPFARALHIHYKVGIVTNGFTRVQRIKQKKFSIDDWCHAYVISEEVGVSKPNEEIFKIALDKLGAHKHQTLMIGDSLTSDYKGALAAGIDFCWVNPHSKNLPKQWPRPQYTVKSVVELAELL